MESWQNYLPLSRLSCSITRQGICTYLQNTLYMEIYFECWLRTVTSHCFSFKLFFFFKNSFKTLRQFFLTNDDKKFTFETIVLYCTGFVWKKRLCIKAVGRCSSFFPEGIVLAPVKLVSCTVLMTEAPIEVFIIPCRREDWETSRKGREWTLCKCNVMRKRRISNSGVNSNQLFVPLFRIPNGSNLLSNLAAQKTKKNEVKFRKSTAS